MVRLKYYMESREEKNKVLPWTGFNNLIKVKVFLCSPCHEAIWGSGGIIPPFSTSI
jgi:hypothetical protein